MTWPWRELSYKQLSKGEIGETAATAADHRNLTEKASITNSAAEVENDWWETAMKLAQAHDVSAKRVHHSSHGSGALKKLVRWEIKLLFEEMKKDRLRMCEAITAMITVASWSS
jgi:hypothetical protein